MVTISDNSSKEHGKDHTSGPRKAAVLLMMIGDEASGAIIKQLDEDEVQEISREIARRRLRSKTPLWRVRRGKRPQHDGPAGEDAGE